MSIADRFAHRHDIGYDALRLEAPEVRPNTPKAYLYFIRDADAATLAHMAIHFRQIAIGQDNLSTTAQQRFANESGYGSCRAVLLHLLDNLFDVGRVLLRGQRIGAFIRATIYIWHGDNMDIRRCAAATRPIEFVRADLDEGGRIAVIGGINNDNVFLDRKSTRLNSSHV